MKLSRNCLLVFLTLLILFDDSVKGDRSVSECYDYCPLDDPLEVEWRAYKETFGKNYPNKSEDAKRKQRYFKIKKEVADHNKRYRNGEEKYTFTRQIDKYADWFYEDIRRLQGVVTAT